MPSRRTGSPIDGSERTWIRDGLHDLRDYAQARGLTAADAALRDAIVQVSLEAQIPTLLSVQDLIDSQTSETSSNALET